MLTLSLLCVVLILQIVNLILSLQKTKGSEKVVAAASQPVTHNLQHPHESLEILEKHNGEYIHHSFRHELHPDIKIYSGHPRFNVKLPNGTLMRPE